MIDFLEPVFGGFMLASASTGAGACPVVPPPQIFVETRRQKTEIRHDLTKDELLAMRSDTNLPYQMQDIAHIETGGMMQGDIRVSYDIVMDEIPGATAETVFDFCVRYQQIRVTLEIAPTIFIAKDHAPDSCWYHEIRQHEESHIDMDQVVVDKYSGRIKDGLALAFSMPEDNVAGPVKKKEISALKKQMGETLMAMVDVMARDMARERHVKQQGVDSVEGYGYIMNQCYDGDNVITIER